MYKRIISLLLVAAMTLSLIPSMFLTTNAATVAQPTISVEEVWAAAGSTVEVDVEISGNPGILGATLTLSWVEGLNLVEAEAGDAFSDLTYQEPSYFSASGTNFVWYGTRVKNIQDGTVLKLTFQVAEDVEESTMQVIHVTGSGLTDADKDPVTAIFVDGGVQIVNYLPGDVDDSNKIDPLDLITLAQFISDGCKTDPNGYNITLNVSAADVNDDGEYTPLDLILISQYISDDCKTDPDGYNIILLPSTPKCKHTMEETPFKAATCEEEGNISYCYCTTCEKYYNNSTGSNEITLASTVLPATGHTAVTDPYVAPTYDSVGWTEGSHCSACNAVLVARQEIPKLELGSYDIEYHFTDSDPYLQSLVASGKLVNKNPDTYTEQDKITLQNLTVAGYTFEGWFDGPWADANRVTTISNKKENISLYAKWTKIVYTVDFDSPDIPINSRTYTVDTGVTLENPSHFGYTFVGWSKDGKIVSSIPVGSIGNITLHANWTSDRNKAVAKKDYGDPVIIEDMDKGQYLFIYEIGAIHNVPISVIENYTNVESLELSDTYEFTQSADSTFTSNIARVLSQATTSTSSWTLSEDWNDSTSAINEHEEERGKTDETTDSMGNTVEGKYYISNVKGGSTSTTNSAGGSNELSAKVTEGTSTGISGSYTKEAGTETSVGVEAGVTIGAGVQVGPAAKRVNVNAEASISSSKNTTDTEKESVTIASERNKNFGTEISGTASSHWDTSSTQSSEWNTTESYEAASATSQNTEISKQISEVIYDKYGYSSTIDRGGENSTTQSNDNSTSESQEYSSTVEYSTGETKTYTTSVTRTYTTPGSYRLVSAGTLHVFAVVGYNIAEGAYFTYTYNVLDSERHLFVDYSKKDNTFRDCENAILPFEVPYSVHEFVTGTMAKSSGLTINEETGIVEKYSGSAEYVTIPEYVSASDDVSKAKAVKIVGISESAFAGNKNIKGVYVPGYVNSIPAGAFAGCSSLETVAGYAITEVGEGAFAGCTALKDMNVDKYIKVLGNNAFTDAPAVKAVASSEAVANAVINSGADSITLDITALESFDDRVIEVAEMTDYFALAGNSEAGGSYSNLRIKSDAKETFLSNMTFVNNKRTPLELNSEKVTLSKVTVDKVPGFALMMDADHTALNLYGTVRLGSTGEHAVISRSTTLGQHKNDISGKLQLTGNYLVCGEVANDSLLSFNSGELKHLTEEEYETMLTSSILTFDPNGGEVEMTEKQIYYGQAYGELPIPTRTGYDFDGWYTDKTEGTKVTAETVSSVLANQTLYAHWNAKAYKVNWDAGTGYTIGVNRTTSPYADATIGALNNGDAIYYGDELTVTYKATDGYTVGNQGIASITVDRDVTSKDIYCTATVNQYSATWTEALTGESGYTIKVSRTSSPLKGAPTEELRSGAAIYHGDVLAVTYTRADYCNITSHGNTTITVTGNVTSNDIYATAELKPVSGWVKVAEMPSNAQCVNQKWSYTLKTTTESKEPSLAGYTQTGSYWVKSGSGSQNYASFPSGFDTGNSIYTSFAKSVPYQNSESTTSKREVSNNWAGYVYWHWMYDCGGANGTANRAIYNKKGNGPDNGFYYQYFGAFTSTNGNYSSDTGHCNSQNIRNYIVPERTAYSQCQGATRWFRFDYYTSTYTDYYKMFQYEKYENKESATEVTASSTISNVQMWVQYREK